MAMNIHGLQKMTLLDYPGKVACTVFLAGCDLRCPYCHNSELLDGSLPPLMDSGELLAFLRKRQGLLDGVCVTGGEPLLRNDLGELLADIRKLGFMIKLDTNGGHPRRLRELIEAGLIDYVAMDVKNSPGRYAETCGLSAMDMAAVNDTVTYLLSAPVEYEFRTTVVAEYHDDASFYDIARWISGAQKYYLQFFVERDTVLRPGLHAPSAEDMHRYLRIVRETVPNAEIRGGE